MLTPGRGGINGAGGRKAAAVKNDQKRNARGLRQPRAFGWVGVEYESLDLDDVCGADTLAS